MPSGSRSFISPEKRTACLPKWSCCSRANAASCCPNMPPAVDAHPRMMHPIRRPRRCAIPTTPDSSPRPSGCLRKRRKHSAGHQNANVRLSKPVQPSFDSAFQRTQCKVTHFRGIFAQKGGSDCKFNRFYDKNLSFSPQNRHYFREVAYE